MADKKQAEEAAPTIQIPDSMLPSTAMVVNLVPEMGKMVPALEELATLYGRLAEAYADAAERLKAQSDKE